MALRTMSKLVGAFELGGAENRVLPMEGLRGIAVALVFCQHYGTQFATYGSCTGFTRTVALKLASFGNYGVELFFVLSGYLIYTILLKKRPSFLTFMARRAQRLYPAFIAAMIIGILADFYRVLPVYCISDKRSGCLDVVLGI